MHSSLVSCTLLLLIFGGHIRAEEPKKGEAANRPGRVKFVPGSVPMKGESAFDGAAFMALSENGPPGPDKLWMQARSGIGDKFPVKQKDGTKLFDVRVAKGDDEHLELELIAKDATQKIELKRDKAVEATVAGIKYEFLFPNSYVAPEKDVTPTTPKAKIMITRPK